MNDERCEKHIFGPMREIKFRALSKHDLKYIEKGEKGFMFYQQTIEDKDGVPELWFVNEEDPDFRYRFEEVFLDDDWHKMEYIGQKDKKSGRDIYEGDIVERIVSYPEKNERELGVVMYRKDIAAFCLTEEKNLSIGLGTIGLVDGSEINKVIGDIFQNKDLFIKSSRTQ